MGTAKKPQSSITCPSSPATLRHRLPISKCQAWQRHQEGKSERYVNGFAGRHNVCEEDPSDQMEHLAAAMVGKRQTYRQLLSWALIGRPQLGKAIFHVALEIGHALTERGSAFLDRLLEDLPHRFGQPGGPRSRSAFPRPSSLFLYDPLVLARSQHHFDIVMTSL